MIVILTCWGKLTRRKSRIVIEVPRSVKAEPNAQLLLRSLSFYLQSASILIREWGDEERKDYLHHVAETTRIDASLVVCDTR